MQSIAAIAATGMQDSSVPQPRLVRAAHEFEAQMMKELLKPMTGHMNGSDALIGESEDSGGDSGSNAVLGEFASEALGRALSQHGGFGMADSIIHDLSRSGTQHGTGKVTGNPHGDTVIRTDKSLK
jgi:Rod binding domain-containing protein